MNYKRNRITRKKICTKKLSQLTFKKKNKNKTKRKTHHLG